MTVTRCVKCNSTLNVEYETSEPRFINTQITKSYDLNVNLPIHHMESLVSLGEGRTPCIKLNGIGEMLGIHNLHAKMELLNPTGSFKDRGASIMLSVAKEHNVTEIVEDSSGNAGAAIAAYAAKAGIKAHIFVPSNTSNSKIEQIKIYDACIHQIEGNRELSEIKAIEHCSKNNLIYASHNLSPYFLEGTKIFAYETVYDFPTELPNHIILPVGNGSLLIGIWKGFQEMIQSNIISKAPRIHCIQAKTIMPITASYNSLNWTPNKKASTIASGISISTPARKHQILEILQQSRGTSIAVTDLNIRKWHKLLATSEGIYAEPTSTVAFAGLEQLLENGTIKYSDKVLIPVTGSGLKTGSIP